MLVDHVEGLGRPAGLPRAGGLLRWFVLRNKALCLALTPRRYQPDRLYRRYDALVAGLVAAARGQTILDVGAGKWSSYADGLTAKNACIFIGLDVDADELELNPFLDRCVLADAASAIPLPPGSVDLAISRATIEHIRDNRQFLANLHRVLKPGGRLICVFAGRNAPFAVLNRLLPPRASRFLIDRLMPDRKDHLGFPTHYDHTTWRGFSRLLAHTGFTIDDVETHYFSSNYFAFFLPVYLISLLGDAVRACLGIKALASYYLFVATKGPAA
ncbi:MAG TPA: methyltransferase domain-containing protein [Candidatus Sulfotelmatobacter sp.]|nr:methyltransferase domain-containing protein [Candidatus Sulfotelmatobacter sp.]